MPFNSRRMPPGRRGADDVLPADLALLADRLSTEAAFLAATYPARDGSAGQSRPDGASAGPGEVAQSACPGAYDSPCRAGLRRRWPGWFKSAAAVLVVAAGLGGLAAVGVINRLAGPPPDQVAGPRGGEHSAPGAASRAPAALTGKAPGGRILGGTAPRAPVLLPAASFQELTGSEQEAVLDLFEENVLAQTSVSI